MWEQTIFLLWSQLYQRRYASVRKHSANKEDATLALYHPHVVFTDIHGAMTMLIVDHSYSLKKLRIFSLFLMIYFRLYFQIYFKYTIIHKNNIIINRMGLLTIGICVLKGFQGLYGVYACWTACGLVDSCFSKKAMSFYCLLSLLCRTRDLYVELARHCFCFGCFKTVEICQSLHKSIIFLQIDHFYS